jgi:hypothetical protein
MTKRTQEYRKIYKKFHGEIPIDEFGRAYDIHHKDGDHSNNSLENLIAIPIQEHYNIHYRNKDYSACVLIGMRMKLDSKEISRLNSLAAKKRVENGTHHWTYQDHSDKVRERIKKSVADGTYHMLGGQIQKKVQLDRSEKGIHQWNGPAHNLEKLKNGTHASQKSFTCPHCGKTGKGSTNAKRWHFDNCRQKGD